MGKDVEKRITAKMVLDSSGYNESIKGVNGSLRQVQSELKNASVQVGVFGRDSEKLKGIQEALARQVDLHAKKVDIWKQSIEKTNTKMQDNIKIRDDLKATLVEEGKKHAEIIKQYGKESKEAEENRKQLKHLGEEYKNKNKQVENNAKQIQYYQTNLNKANAEMGKAQGELRNINEELARSGERWLGASESLKKSSDKLKDIGGKIEGVGNKLLKLTAPMVGIGAIALKFSTEFEDSMAKVSTIADETEVPIDDLRKQILKLSSDTGIASTEIANNVYDAISAGQKTGDAVNYVANSTKLAKAGFAEAGASLDILTTIMNAYKMESSEVSKVSDILVQTQNKGKVTVGELSASMGKVIPTAVATNVSLNQLGAGYAILTSNGIKAAEATTYMNSMLNELSKTGSDADEALREMTNKSFAELMKEGKSVSDVLGLLDEYAKKSNLSLKDMFGSAEAGKAALVLSTNAGKDFNAILKDMDNSAGSTDKAFEKVTNTTGEKFRKSINKLKNDAIKFGDVISPILDKGAELIGKISDKLGQLDEQQLQTIAKSAMLVVGLGGVLKVSGGLISTVGSVTGGLSKLSGALGAAKLASAGVGTAASVAGGAGGLGALATGLGGAVVAAGPFLLAGAAVAGVGYAVYKGMTEEAIPAIDLFADKVEHTASGISSNANTMSTAYETTVTKISESTKVAVGAYVELDNSTKDHLDNLHINSIKITEEMKNELITKYDEMGLKINQGIEQKRNESLEGLREFFGTSKAIADTEEAEILANTEEYYKQKQEKVKGYEGEIIAIMEKASKEKRALTSEEVTEINRLQEEMKNEAIKLLSENELEAKIILERMKEYDTRITAEQASEHIKKLNESKDKAIEAAEEEYEKRLATIIKMRDEAKVISSDQADAMIKDAQRQRDGIIEKAEETKEQAIKKMKELNSDLEKEVDTSTGNILTWWDKLKNWWNGWKPATKEFKTVEYTDYRKTYSQEPIPQNYSGTSSWGGGLTTLHERGYEVYDLPRGTRIYNNEASEDMVLKTAEAVAKRILLQNNVGSKDINVTQYISVPVPSASEVARQTKKQLQIMAYEL